MVETTIGEYSRFAVILQTFIRSKQNANAVKRVELPVLYGKEKEDLINLLQTDEDFVLTFIKNRSDRLIVTEIH